MHAVQVLFTPADFTALAGRDLSRTTCVVFDVLRATTTLLAALDAGAAGVLPAADIPEALAAHRRHPGALLAGERDGVRIRADRTGGVDFDLGNSPREFTPERVAGRLVIATTTNGTRALRACAGAAAILPGGLVNAGRIASWIARTRPAEVLLVCSGTYEDAAYEDILGAGAVVSRLAPILDGSGMLDSTRLAQLAYEAALPDLAAAMGRHSRNGRRLLGMPDLAGDVDLCASEDSVPVLARVEDDGIIRGFEPGEAPAPAVHP